MSPPLLRARFRKQFPEGPEIVVEDLQIGSGVTVLFGESGSGKTTILRCVAGLEQPDAGTIRFQQEVWYDEATRTLLPPRRRGVGLLPQDYALFPHLTVARNVGYGLQAIPRPERHQRVRETLSLLGLQQLAGRLPHELSGGQQQRVALARAVARRPRLLLLDEPLSALDAPTRQRLRGELRQWLEQLAIPTLLVTHDRTEALALGSSIVVLNEGRIEQTGPILEVFNHPANLAVATIAGVETVVPGRVCERNGGLVTVEVGSKKLLALAEELPLDTRTVHVCIRAEDVILTRGQDPSSSARNRLHGKVLSVDPQLPMTRVALDCGFELKAMITRQALEELAIRPGTEVVASVKAPHVHLIAV